MAEAAPSGADVDVVTENIELLMHGATLSASSPSPADTPPPNSMYEMSPPSGDMETQSHHLIASSTSAVTLEGAQNALPRTRGVRFHQDAIDGDGGGGGGGGRDGTDTADTLNGSPRGDDDTSDVSSLSKSIASGSFFNVPLDHPRGWVVVFSGAVNFFVLFGIVSSFTVFLNAFSADPAFAGSSIAILNLAGSLQLALARVIGLFGGYLIEKVGTRKLLGLSAVAQFLAYFSTSYVSNIAGLVGVYTSLMLFAMGFALVPVLTAVSSFFSVKRNLAQGVLGAGSGLGSAVFPLIIAALLNKEAGDWRSVFRICSIFSILSLVAAIFSPIRDDGVAATPLTAPRQFSRRKLYSSKAFVILCVYCFMLGFSLYGQNFMVMPYTLQYTDRSTAVLVPFASGLASVAGNVIIGWLTDRLGLRRTQMVGYVLNGVFCVIWAHGVRNLAAMFVVMSLQFFARPVGTATVVTQLFRGHHLGEALAGTYIFIGIGGAVSPPMLAAITEAQGGSYIVSLWICAATSVITAATLWFLPQAPVDIYVASASDEGGGTSDMNSRSTTPSASVMGIECGSPLGAVATSGGGNTVSRRRFSSGRAANNEPAT